MMQLYNSLTRQKEDFTPLKPPTVLMYVCGPTVYGPGHLGHARTYINFDLLRRALINRGLNVNYVMNITDIHDDVIKTAKEQGVSILELTERYAVLFFKDLKSLNVLPATAHPRVTACIPEIITMVKTLLAKGFAYVEKDGSVYFRVEKFAHYGQLAGIKRTEAKTGTRVETDKYEKADFADFALWKSAKAGEPAAWESPWGLGRPGWHIECSVMSKKFLGETLDIHAGAMDLKFPHHENEIAQSEAANGVPFVRFWLHAGLLDIDGQKMSKSLKNYLEIWQIQDRGFNPLDLRYLFLNGHYRQKMNFTWEALKAAQSARLKLVALISNYRQESQTKKRSVLSAEKLAKLDQFKADFEKAISDDLNIPQALAVLWTVVKSNIPDRDKFEAILSFDEILGLDLAAAAQGAAKAVPTEVVELLRKRNELRQAGQWQEADLIRQKVEALGFTVADTAEDSRVF